MGNVNQCVFVPLQAVYGPPKTENEELFFDLWENALEQYDDERLEGGVKAIIENRIYPSWPTLAEVVGACRSFVVKPSQGVQFSAYSEAPEPEFVKASDEQKARVQGMVDDLNKIIAKHVEEQQHKVPPTKFYDRPAFEKIQRESPNIDLMMTEHGKAKFRETGRKPEHRKPNLRETDTFKEMERAYNEQHGKKSA